METEKIGPENRENREVVTSKIDLRFFRHGEKESDKTKPDEEMRLTETGKRQAVEKSVDKDITQAVAFGSPRKRTQETAGLVMTGQLDEITGKEGLEELREKLDKELKVGSKIGVDKRLDLNSDSTSEYGKKAYEAFKNSGKFLKFLVEESDALAESLKDKTAFTYSRQASNVAEFLAKYLAIAPRWDNLAQDENKSYGDTLKRFFSTHQGIAESFLAKIIEQTKGKEERDAFVTALGNKGFDYAEGFNVEISTVGGKEQRVRISYKKEKDGKTLFAYDEIVPKEKIEGLILRKLKKE